MHFDQSTGLWTVFAAALALVAGGVPACCLSRHSVRAQRATSVLMVLGSLLGWCGLAMASFGTSAVEAGLPWHLPWEQRLSIGLDAIGAVFLIPVFTVPMLGSIYGLAYWRQGDHPENGRGVGLFYGLLAGSMALVVLARNAILFLIVWELMALAAFFLAGAEHEKAEVRRAGWIYLVATHAGTLCLLALFALMRQASGGFAFGVLDAGALTPGMVTLLFILSVVGFGFKAGLMPLHVWLPGAHANAPSHVSAVMSGVMLKMGVYGMVRMISLLPISEAWNGGALLAVGAVTGILGIAFAIGQNDIKRLLAYSSIENIGIICMGIGMALLGRTLHRADLVLLGLGGALLHVWNHSLFKSLLFLNSGAIIHAVHSREMNRMGGLAKPMPQTAWLFLIGAVAICGLPPLNGFASEWLIYLGLFQGPTTGVGAVALALIGALALACFVKIYGMVFLGTARDPLHGEPHDPSAAMRHPMALLAAGCVVLGFLPHLGFPLLHAAASQWLDPAGGAALPEFEEFAPAQWISAVAVGLVAAAGLGYALLRRRIRRTDAAVGATWGCGYAQPTPRMQYTGSSFGDVLVGLFGWVLRPRTSRPALKKLFPDRVEFACEVQDTVLHGLVLPVFRRAAAAMMKLRRLQQGRLDLYLLYLLVILIVLLSWGRHLGL
ncbi:MAG: hydrogenase [Lentisphaerae bacterium]|nr:hydrogenase [Lentisphaerota bacterium]